MTDSHTDLLFDTHLSAHRIEANFSRLVCDVERIPIDDLEPMSALGMGVIYERTSDGRPLRSSLDDKASSRMLELYYRPHHARLNSAVSDCLYRYGHCLIIDCHSYNQDPQGYEDANKHRPQICIGTDADHTSVALQTQAMKTAKRYFEDVSLNTPFSGALVSSDHHLIDYRVQSIMIEIRKDTYLEAGRPSLVKMQYFKKFLNELIATCHDL